MRVGGAYLVIPPLLSPLSSIVPPSPLSFAPLFGYSVVLVSWALLVSLALASPVVQCRLPIVLALAPHIHPGEQVLAVVVLGAGSSGQCPVSHCPGVSIMLPRPLGSGMDIENREVHVKLLYGWRSVADCAGIQLSWDGGIWQVFGSMRCSNVVVAFPVMVLPPGYISSEC
jgi:hypothetical protein